MNRKLAFSALAAAVLAVGSAGAAQLSSPQSSAFQVSITIQNSCGITATDVGFGTFPDAASAHNEGTAGTVTVTCSGSGPIKVTLDAGTNNPTYGSSQMKFGGNFVGYALYSAANGVGLLGDGVNGGTPVFNGTATGGGTPDAFTIHGYTNTSGGAVPDGTYTDTVTATVTF